MGYDERGFTDHREDKRYGETYQQAYNRQNFERHREMDRQDHIAKMNAERANGAGSIGGYTGNASSWENQPASKLGKYFYPLAAIFLVGGLLNAVDVLPWGDVLVYRNYNLTTACFVLGGVFLMFRWALGLAAALLVIFSAISLILGFFIMLTDLRNFMDHIGFLVWLIPAFVGIIIFRFAVAGAREKAQAA
jgi:hypothetical protein